MDPREGGEGRHRGAAGDNAKRWGHRTRPPEATLAALAPHLARMGITRLGDLTGLDTVGLPVAQAMRPFGRSLSVAQGKGTTQAAALASAAMEAAEGWHAEDPPGPARRGRLDLPVAADWLPGGGRWREVREITLLAGIDLLDGAEAWLPADLVHKDYVRPPEIPGLRRSTNGLASGNTPDEALSAALHEVIERHSVAEFATGDRGRATAVDPARIADLGPDSAFCVARVRAAGLRLLLTEMTGALGVPVLRAEIVEPGSGRGAPLRHQQAGFGCHLCPETAAVRAITEAAQSRLTDIAGSRDDICESRYVPDAEGSALAALAHVADRLERGAAPFDLPDRSGASAAEDVARLLERLAAAGCPAVYAVDLSRADLPVHVVRAVVPGLGWLAGHHAMPGALPLKPKGKPPGSRRR